MATIELGHFADADPNEFAAMIAAPDNAELAKDFPSLRERYGTPKEAKRSIGRVAKRVRRDLGFVARTVVVNDALRGVITAYRADRPGDVEDGINVAYYLDERRGQHERRIGAEVLQKFAIVTLASPGLRGTPWTVVRTDNVRSIRVLEDTENGFGGFEASGEPRVWDVGDGITIERQLYVATHSLEELRANT